MAYLTGRDTLAVDLSHQEIVSGAGHDACYMAGAGAHPRTAVNWLPVR